MTKSTLHEKSSELCRVLGLDPHGSVVRQVTVDDGVDGQGRKRTRVERADVSRAEAIADWLADFDLVKVDEESGKGKGKA